MRSLALLALAACSSPVGPITAHVTHYDYALDLDSRASAVKVTLVADKEGNCVTLPFRASDFGAPKFNGIDANATVDPNGAVEICGDDGVEAGDTFDVEATMTIDLATLSVSQVGYSVTMDSAHNPFTYMVSWVNGCDRFGPCDSRPDQFATYRFDVTHAANLTVRCSGDITEPSPTETICDFTHAGGPTYSTFGLAAYPAWTQSDLGDWNGVHVTLYDRSATGIMAGIDTTWHSGFIAWMESQFGPYPFGGDLRLLTAPTYWNGFEHPGNIVLADSLTRQVGYANTLQHTLDHEMTHMWAGDQTTIASTYDFVWKESMAEYLTYVYEDMQDPAVSLTTSDVWKADSSGARYFPVPLDQPELFAYYGDVYGPGPMVLFRQLEALTSREQVLAAIATVLGKQRALTVDELLAALADKTGLDLTDYVASWIKGSGAPNWPQVDLTYTPGSLAVHVANQTTPPRGCKFHVALRGANAGEVVKVAVDTFHDGSDQTIAVTAPAFAVTKLDLDPDHECLVFLKSESPRRAPHEPWVNPEFSER